MAEETSFGVRRLRQAITNQATCGSGQFELSIDSADRLCREIEEELENLSWAKDAPVPRDAGDKAVPLDTAVLYTDKGEKVSVDSICFNGHFWYVKDTRRESRRLDRLHLHRPDSWERLEEDIRNAETGGTCGYYGWETKPCNEDCPAKKDLKIPCSAIALKDALRRAKALAGVGES